MAYRNDRRLESDHANESEVATLSPVSAGVDEPASLGFALLGTRPNPSLDGSLRIDFVLPGPGPACIELMDLAGRKVFSKTEEWSAGSHVLPVGETEPLRAEVYFVRLVRGGRSLESKVVVAR